MARCGVPRRGHGRGLPRPVDAHRLAWDGAAAYVDPVMVLVTCAVFLRPPLRMVRTTILELLEGAPPLAMQQPVLDVVRDVFRQFEIAEPVVRMTKVGQKLYVEIEAEVRPDATVADEHRVRTAVRRGLEAIPLEVWLNFELTPRPVDTP